MNVPPKQAHVLANLDRVVPLAGKLGSSRLRFQLDGVECTAQIIGLSVRKLISKHSTGGFRRLGEIKVRDGRVGERQSPIPGSIDAIRATLSAPHSVRTIGVSKR